VLLLEPPDAAGAKKESKSNIVILNSHDSLGLITLFLLRRKALLMER
jgi:hypothetical protein